MRLQIDHVQPSAVGTTVRADATLEKVEGRRLTFVVNAHDSRGLIAAGRVTRVIVDRDRFMEKTAANVSWLACGQLITSPVPSYA